MGVKRAALLACVLAGAAVPARAADDPRDGIDPRLGGVTRSLGFPAYWHLSVGAAGGVWLGPQEAAVVEGRAMFAYDLVLPAASLVRLGLEGTFGGRGGEWFGGGRIELFSPVLRLGAGVDWQRLDNTLTGIITVRHPLLRGGFLLDGALLRLDWLPARDHTVLLGLELPLEVLGNPRRPRPDEGHVNLPTPDDSLARVGLGDAALERALSPVTEAARTVWQLTLPHLDAGGATRATALEQFGLRLTALERRLEQAARDAPDGNAPVAAVRRFHALLAHAYAVAARGEAEPVPEGTTALGERLAALARAALLEGVLVPYDRLLGQRKEAEQLLGLGEQATGLFLHQLAAEGELSGPGAVRVVALFAWTARLVERLRAEAREGWGHSRLEWLPLQLGLLPEEHDQPAELERLVERLVERRFTDGNRIWFLANERFELELIRTIAEARDYHVLWVHDVTGRDAAGAPDRVTFELVAQYLGVLATRLEAYDTQGVLPVFLVFVDQWFFEAKDGRLWLEVLADPLRAKNPFDGGDEPARARLEAIRARLARALQGSRLLQAEGKLHGRAWLSNRVKVHVSITNPADPSFFTWQVAIPLGLPDDVMRDHRKIVFHDVTEEDPYRGFAIFTGMGVGAEYAGPQWEDRAVLATGPMLIDLKDAARRLLRSQGFTEGELPWVLRERERAPDWEARLMAAQEDPAFRNRAMQLHNETGFAPKPASVAKAAYYSLLPPGSVVISPDSLWMNELWAGMLAGLALRGGKVLVVAPGRRGAPSAGFPQLSRMEETLARLILAGERLGPRLAAAGGLLRVGLYDTQIGVQDLPARLRKAARTLEEQPFLRDLAGFDPAVQGALREGATRAEAALGPLVAPQRENAAPPKLHMKSGLFVLPAVWGPLLARPEWAALLGIGIDARIEYLRTHREPRDFRAQSERYLARAAPLVRGLAEAFAGVDERLLGAWVVEGSHNQDYRSMFLDGEVVVVVSGPSTLLAMIDLLLIALESRWVSSLAELGELLPPASQLKRFIGRWGESLL